MKELTVLSGLLWLMINFTNAQTMDPATTRFSWDDGITFEYDPDSIKAENNQTEIKMGGRIMYDATFFNQDESLSEEVGSFKNALELRRVRLYNSGKLFYGSFAYKLQLEFSGGEVVFRDAYLEYNLMQLSKRLTGKLRAGQFKEPLRMEVQLSSNNMVFIERSYLSGFSTERNSGFMYHIDDSEKQFSFQFGVFGNGDDVGNDLANNDGFNVTTRMTYLPLQTDDDLLHLGFGYSHRDAGDVGKYSYSTRPPAHTAPKYLNAKIENVSTVQLFNPELVYIHQNLMIESEFLFAKVNSETAFNFSSFYGQLSYLINSQSAKSSHRYKGAYEGIGEDLGKNGVWEIAARYSVANLNDGTFQGGKISDVTLAVNYHINPRVRIMANYSFINLHDVGKASDLNLRFLTYF
ncbi:MAG: hypothetical protein HKN76_22985 [Saprospiraceae bacterium]|nr:hypothetical protein [Saprospiraceae bacterium]